MRIAIAERFKKEQENKKGMQNENEKREKSQEWNTKQKEKFMEMIDNQENIITAMRVVNEMERK